MAIIAGSTLASVGGEISLALLLMSLFALFVLGWFVWFVITQCNRVQRQQMISLMAMIGMALVFFTLYEQTYGSWVIFTDRLLTKDLFPSAVRASEAIAWTPDAWSNIALFFSHAPWSIVSLVLAPASFVVSAMFSDRHAASKAPKIVFGSVFSLMLVFLVRDLVILPQTAGSLTYLGALFLVLLAPIFTFLWGWLGRRGEDPSKPVKSALGLLLAALSFIPLALAAQHAGSTGAMASVWWLVAAYFVLEAGEMCLSPVGLSAVTQLSMPKVVSLMMGTWFLATAFSEALAALFGKLAAIEIPEGEVMNFADAAAKYSHLFWLLMWIGIGCAAAAFVAAPLLRKWMHGVR